MTTTDPRARQLAEAVHGLARQKATILPAWPDLSLSEREKVTAEARLWLRAAVDAGLVPPATDRATLRDRIAEALYERERPPRDPHWPKTFASDRETFEAMADAVLAVTPIEVTVAELTHAIDNSTPYPVELDRALCTFMAERLLEMLTINKRPEHAVWQPEEPPGPSVEPMDPATFAAGQDPTEEVDQ